MKITDEMVDKACAAYSLHIKPEDGVLHTVHGNWMRDALEAAVDEAKTDKPNRWDAFSDDEIKEIYAGAHDRELRHALPAHNRGVANKLANDANDEIRRRRGGYQGPGIYGTYTGMRFKVYGRIGDNGEIVQSVMENGGMLYTETWEDFNYVRSDGTPTYTYLRALDD